MMGVDESKEGDLCVDWHCFEYEDRAKVRNRGKKTFLVSNWKRKSLSTLKQTEERRDGFFF